jgi:hypothetical protein
VVASLALAACPGVAHAATPTGFFGVTYDREILDAPSALQDAQFRAMKANHVQSVRAVFDWSIAQPQAGGPIGFARTDALVERAARNGLIVLPCVLYAPAWAQVNAFAGAASPPKSPGDYGAYLTALVGRYGPNGSFWADHPALKKRPIRDWQIWNEPSLTFQWNAPHWQRGYGALVRAANSSLKAADRGSRTVLAGLPNKSWEELASLYRLGKVKGAFDVASINGYTGAPKYVLLLAQYMRAVMKRNGDAKKAMWMTEMGLPAAKGFTKSANSLQTTNAGMGRFLHDVYTLMAGRGRRADANVGRVYWYTWASPYRGNDIFEYAGLNRFRDGTLVTRPALGVYRAVAKRLQG